MLVDLLKYQSLSNISKNFIGYISKKYNNHITIGEYIIERLIHKKINIGFSYKGNCYTPFFGIANKYSDFDTIFHSYEASSGYSALSYAKYTNNLGLILSTSTYGFNNISKSLENAHYNKIPLLLMSFYDQDSESKLCINMRPERKFMKESHTIKKPDAFPNLLEYVMMITELPQNGPVHLNIHNNILNNKVDLYNINLKHKDDIDEMITDDENLSLLQYYEKKYERTELYELYKNHDKMHENSIKNNKL